MTDIDAIMDLSKALEPAVKVTPQFHLWSDSEGLWYAKVGMAKYHCQTDGHESPEGALKKLRADLTRMNQSFIKRMTAAIRQWANPTPSLRLIKSDSK